VRAVFDARRHTTLATLSAGGTQCFSGIATAFEDGEVVFGSMPDARKAPVPPGIRG
jgi:hypothetical protein